MSKVLVDRELLRDCSAELSDWRMSFPDAETGMTGILVATIDAILAQIEEAEGVSVVGVVCISHFKNNPAMENVEFHLAADLPQGQHEVILHSSHLAALSAVTAERDRLRVEVESLRKDAERYRWIRQQGLPDAAIIEMDSYYDTVTFAKDCRLDTAVDDAMQES